eukprot:3752034-Prymnesium_polylepis.1
MGHPLHLPTRVYLPTAGVCMPLAEKVSTLHCTPAPSQQYLVTEKPSPDVCSRSHDTTSMKVRFNRSCRP